MTEERTARLLGAFLDLEGRLAIVVGSDARAERRAAQLVRAGADVVVVAARPTSSLLDAEYEGHVTVEQRGYVRGDLAGAFLAICTERDDEIQRAVFEEAESIGCLVNVLDAPHLCSFTLPTAVRRGAVQVAITTGGASPEVARILRSLIAEQVGPEWGAWALLVAEVRVRATAAISDSDERERVLAAVLEPAVRERLAAGEHITADEFLAQIEAEEDEE